MWHVINKKVGKSLKHDKKIELHIGTNIISDSQEGTDMLNKFFVEQINELIIIERHADKFLKITIL
jgi:hypothetical protein